MTHENLLQEFYTAFKNRDPEIMARCYHPAAEFSDPIFSGLKSEEVKDMWRMLISRGKETKIEFGPITCSGNKGSVHWEARYPYGPKRRMVHNVVDSEFEFLDGKILRQKDSFALWAWLGMALGPIGKLLGWSSLLQNKVRTLANRGLREFIDQKSL